MDLSMEQPQTTTMPTTVTTPTCPDAANPAQDSRNGEETLCNSKDLEGLNEKVTDADLDMEASTSPTDAICNGAVHSEQSSESNSNCEHDLDCDSDAMKCDENENNSVDDSTNVNEVDDSKIDFKGDVNKLLSRKKEILPSFSVDSGLDMNKNCESSEEDGGGVAQDTPLDTSDGDILNTTITQSTLDTGQPTEASFSDGEKTVETEPCVAETIDPDRLPNSAPTIILSPCNTNIDDTQIKPSADQPTTEEHLKSGTENIDKTKSEPQKRQSVKDKIKARRRQTSSPIPLSPNRDKQQSASPMHTLRSASFEGAQSGSTGSPGAVPTIQVNDAEQTEEKEDAPLATQLAMLQSMVGEMKAGFVVAMEALSRIQYGDEMLTQKVDDNQAQHQEQLADVINMVLTLKGEFSVVLEQLHAATDAQRGLEVQVQRLQYERDILLEELEKAGTISPTIRQQYHSGQLRPHTLNRSNSNTTLAVLLERARNTFATTTPVQHHSSPLGTSTAHSSGASLRTSSSTLRSKQHGGVESHNSSGSQADSGVVGLGHTPPNHNHHHHHHQVPTVHLSPARPDSPLSYTAAGGSVGYPADHDIPPVDPDPTVVSGGYESDSSITAAANKSLDLSRSLGNCCSDQTDPVTANQSDEEEEEDEVEDGYRKLTSPPPQDPYDHSSPFKGSKSSSAPRPLPPHERNAADTQRSRVAREIVETERKYCSTLWTVLDHFALPVRDCGYLAPRDVCLMFPASLSRIYDLHCDFLQQLEDRLLNWKYHGVIGDLFAKFTDSPECQLLAHYQQYVNEFPSSLQLIKKLSRGNVKLRRLLKVLQRHPVCESLDLSSFLLAPIQRVPRYVLLLKQLLKYTAKDHPDVYHLEASINKLATFLTRLNDSIEQSMDLVTAADSTITSDNSMQEHSPKPRRKLRIPSFRQQSSYQDTSTMSTDGAPQEGTSVRRGSTGPFGSFLKEKRPYQSAGQLPHTPRKLPIPPPSLALDGTPTGPVKSNEAKSRPRSKSPAVTNKTESNVTPTSHSSSNTLPLRARKRRSQLNKRPKSGSDFVDGSVDGVNESMTGEKRVLAVVDSNSSCSSSSVSGVIRRPRSVVTGIAEETEEEEGEDKSRSPAQAQRCRSAPLQRTAQHRPLHRSMPKIPPTPYPGDYGILGKDDTADEENDEADLTRLRSHSQDTLDEAVTVSPNPPPSPSQRRINASVARSLSQREPARREASRDTANCSRMRDIGSMTLPAQPPTVIRAWGPDQSSPGNNTLLNETIDMLNMTEPTGVKPTKRRGWRKKKRLTESMIEPDTSSNRWKVANLKSSIKNIFFRKRKLSTSTPSSQETSPCTTPQEYSRGSRVFADVSPAASLHSLPTIHSTSHLDNSMKNTEPTTIHSAALNGDPVSAV